MHSAVAFAVNGLITYCNARVGDGLFTELILLKYVKPQQTLYNEKQRSYLVQMQRTINIVNTKNVRSMVIQCETNTNNCTIKLTVIYRGKRSRITRGSQ